MEIKKLQRAATVGAGTTVLLTNEQAQARAHLLDDGKGKQHGKGKTARKPFVARSLLHFKAGEELAIAGGLDRHLEIAFGDVPDEGKTVPTDAQTEELAALEKAKADAEVATETAKTELAKIEQAKSEAQDLLDKILKEIDANTGGANGDQNPAS